MTCQQFVFGKLVRETRGAILAGYEHKCTGRSSDFPKEAAKFCHPTVTGLSPGDNFDWDRYPWREGAGGMISKPIRLPSGDVCVLTGRVIGLSERGVGKPGRFFNQAHYVTIPVGEWHYWCVRNLYESLKAEPMLAEDYNLPPLHFNDSGLEIEPLPGNWNKICGRMLELLMSGEPISVQNWELSVQDFLEQVRLCLCLVPAALAWRVPWGAGLVGMDGTVALAHGMMANQGPRVVADELRGTESLDTSCGKAYLEFLGHQLQNAKTLFEAREIINQRFSEYSKPDGIPYETDWRQVAKGIGRIILEETLLLTFRASQQGIKIDLNRQFECRPKDERRKEALDIALERIDKDGLDCLQTAAVETWKNVWQDLVKPDGPGIRYAIAELLGMRPLDKPALLELVRGYQPGSDLAADAVKRVTAAVAASEDPESWTGLVRTGVKDAEWLNQWRAVASPQLNWLACRKRNQGLVDALVAEKRELLRTGLEAASNGDLAPLSQLLDLAGEREIEFLRQLADELEAANARQLCALIQSCRSSPDAAKNEQAEIWIKNLVDSPDRFCSFVRLLAKEMAEPDHMLAQSNGLWLLAGWNMVSNHMPQNLQIQLAEKIGQPFAGVLLGVDAESKAPAAWRPICREAIWFRLKRDKEFWHHLIEAAGRTPGDEIITQTLIEWLARIPDVRLLQEFKPFKLLANFIKTGVIEGLVELDADKDYALLKPFRDRRLQGDVRETPLNRLHLENEFELRWALEHVVWLGESNQPSDDQFCMVLKRLTERTNPGFYEQGFPEQRVSKSWVQIIKERGWADKPKWRLINLVASSVAGVELPAEIPTSVDSLEKAEQVALKKAGAHAKLFLLLEFAPLLRKPDFALRPDDLAELKPCLEEYEKLISICKENEWERQLGNIRNHIILILRVMEKSNMANMEKYVSDSKQKQPFSQFVKKMMNPKKKAHRNEYEDYCRLRDSATMKKSTFFGLPTFRKDQE